MSKYCIHLIYAVSFVMTNAMQYTSSETNMHMNKGANQKDKVHTSCHRLKPNSEAHHQDTTKKGSANTKCGKARNWVHTLVLNHVKQLVRENAMLCHI